MEEIKKKNIPDPPRPIAPAPVQPGMPVSDRRNARTPRPLEKLHKSESHSARKTPYHPKTLRAWEDTHGRIYEPYRFTQATHTQVEAVKVADTGSPKYPKWLSP